MRATTTCPIAHDRVKYSIDSKAAEVAAEHPRSYPRDQVIYDPWRYLPALMRKPGELENDAPFKD